MVGIRYGNGFFILLEVAGFLGCAIIGSTRNRHCVSDVGTFAIKNTQIKLVHAAIVAEKTAAKEQIETEIAALSDNISTLKEQLKGKKSALKVAAKELSKAEAKKEAAEKKAAEESKKAEAESVLKKLLASGMSADEIIAKLQ